MKKTFFKRALCLSLAFFMMFVFVPHKAKAAAIAPNGYAMMRQTDSQWNSVYFNGGSLTATGCGIFSLVNAVGYLTGKQMDVVEVASWAYDVGAFNSLGANGTDRTVLYRKVTAKYGQAYGISLDCASSGGGYWYGVNTSSLKNHLANGGVAIAHVYNHFIALVGYDYSSDSFHVWDSAPSSRRGTLASNGDLWLSTYHLSNATYMTVDWFCLVSAVETETWRDKAAFEADVYKSKYEDLKNMSNEELKNHWVDYGIKEGRCASTILDLVYYADENEDLVAAFGRDYTKIYNHFVETGYKEHRKSSRLFDGEYYCNRYPDIVAVYKDDYLLHYVDFGMKEGRRGSLLFDVSYYLFIRPDVAEMWPGDLAAAARHYASHGINEGMIAYDKENPVISDVKISNLSSEGYTVTCKVSDNWGIDKVVFPTWTDNNEQDDLIENWPETTKGTQNGDVYTYDVKISDHKNEKGIYFTHIYAYDKGGNEFCWRSDKIIVQDGLNEITLKNSSSYEKTDKSVGKVAQKTDVATFLKEFENEGLKVYDINGKELASSQLVGTGSKVELYNGDSLIDTIFVIIKGDIDGNGIIDSTDYIRVKGAFTKTFSPDSNQEIATDVDESGSIDSTDYMRIKGQFLGTFQI